MPFKHYWQCRTQLVWSKSVCGKNSHDYSNHYVLRFFDMHGYHKIARPVAKRFPFRLHGRLPNTIGNGRRAWFGSNPSAGIIVMTIPTIVYDDIQQSNCEWEGQNLSACGELISIPTERMPFKHYWKCRTHLVWSKSVGGKNSHDYSNHHVNWVFLICMGFIKMLGLCQSDFHSDCTDAFQTLLAMLDALGLVEICRREK